MTQSKAQTSEQTLDIHGKSYNRWAMVALMIVGTFAGMLNQTSLGTALPTLIKDFNLNVSTAQQANTWFLLANGIMIPVTAYLATKFSTKLLYIIAYSLLVAGSFILVSTSTDSWWMFIAGRIIQAIAVGITMPLMQVVFVNMFSPKQMGAVMGLSGIVIGVAPAIGPTFSGWILDANHTILGLTLSNSWRTIFLIPMFILIAVLILTPFIIHDVIPNRDMKLDFFSLVLSVFGFGSFLYGFTNVANDGWGNMPNVVLPIIIGVVLIVIFGLRQLKLKDPFLDVTVFKIRQFTISTIIAALVVMAMMGVEMMLPLYMQSVRGLTPLASGLVLLPGALMMAIMSPFAGRAYDKVGAKRLAQVGFAIVALGTLPFMFFKVDTPDHFITLLYGLRMMGVAMVMMPTVASAMNSLPREESAHGTAANNTARQIASAVVVAILSSVAQNIINNNLPNDSLKSANPLKFANDSLMAALDGYHASFAIGFGIAVAGFIMAFFLRPPHNQLSKAEIEKEQKVLKETNSGSKTPAKKTTTKAIAKKRATSVKTKISKTKKEGGRA